MISTSSHRVITAFALGQTDFENIHIKGATLQAQFLPFINFHKAGLPEADFRHAVLPAATFSGAVLKQSNFEHANLLAAQLDWVNLAQANLAHALLTFTTMVGANLANANLSSASLSGANLTSANLRNANLAGTNLRGTNLSKANLFGARVDPKALADAHLEFTVMPSGECVSRSHATPTPPVSLANLMSYVRLSQAVDRRFNPNEQLPDPALPSVLPCLDQHRPQRPGMLPPLEPAEVPLSILKATVSPRLASLPRLGCPPVKGTNN
ncbi:MAG: pentapeptide repeat-containing protein [Leptolyngbyaceae cyanobacterium]